jgi:diguanylate cyclase (GGDEF)-like protein
VSLSAGRIAGAGLAIAASTIAILAAVLLNDLSRERTLSQEMLAAQQVKVDLESLMGALQRLRFATFAFAMTGQQPHAADFERERVVIEGELENLRAKASEQPAFAEQLAGLEPIARDLLDVSGVLVLSRRANRTGARTGATAFDMAEEQGKLAIEAVQRAMDAVAREITTRSVEQIDLGERRRLYVSWLVAGSVIVLLGLVIAFRLSQQRGREAQRRIEQLAHFDPLTGLPNRSLLHDRLGHAITLAARNAAPAALLLFDLDGFKGVNDTLGHAAGDKLLATVGERARACMRASDTVGRLGGDEFVAILPETDRDGAERVALKLLEMMAMPFELGPEVVSVSASMGGSFYPADGGDGDELLKAADVALYAAKREGKNRYHAYSGESDAKAPSRGVPPLAA